MTNSFRIMLAGAALAGGLAVGAAQAQVMVEPVQPGGVVLQPYQPSPAFRPAPYQRPAYATPYVTEPSAPNVLYSRDIPSPISPTGLPTWAEAQSRFD